MSTFILVHGSFLGAWCWERVIPLLESEGHRVIAPDLPGHGQDKTPVEQRTLASYVERVVQIIDAQSEPVVLVGHSMGGVVITQAAEERSARIERLVYVCAFLPRDGQCLLDLAKTDGESRMLPNLTFEGGMHWLADAAIGDVLFHDCSPADADRAGARMVKEPIVVVETPVHVTAARFGSLPRTYIETTEDRGLGLGLQRRMHTETPCQVRSMATSHAPFYAAPAELVRALIGGAS